MSDPVYEYYGKVSYARICIDHPDRAWSYCADALKAELEQACLHQRLTGLYVNLNGYLDAFAHDEFIIDLTYLGGPTLLLFEKTAVEIDIHGEGLVQYRILPMHNLKIKKLVGYPPDDMGSNETYFFDAAFHFQMEFWKQTVTGITVKGTNTRAFNASFGFDAALADEAERCSALPNEIAFHLSDGNTVYLQGDELENYQVGIR